jgi:Ca-activated chloride channel family protein
VPERLLRLLSALAPYGLVALVGGAVALGIDATLPAERRAVELAAPGALWLLLGAVLLAWVGFHLAARRAPTFSFSRVADLASLRRGALAWLAPLPRVLRVVAVGLCAVALARPQVITQEEVALEGIDIMLVLDLSKSMQERDLVRNRLDAAQRTIRAFIAGKTDRIGLVIFAKQAMLQCPLTTDMATLDRIVADLAIGAIDPMGTAIGDGLGVAVAAMRRSESKSKVIILLTDGDSNVVNVMSPEESIDAAKAKGIRVFTVLMGRELEGGGPPEMAGYGTNPALLKRIAAETDGRYFHAGDTAALERGFAAVRATLEKTKLKEVRRIPTELYPRFVAPALGLVVLEILLGLTRWRRFP